MSDEILKQFFARLDNAITVDQPEKGWANQLHAQAHETYKRIQIPSFKDKSWNKLSMAELTDDLAVAGDPEIRVDNLDDDKYCARVTLSEKEIIFQIGPDAAHQGVVICSLEEAGQNYPKLLNESLPLTELFGEDKMASFNLAASRHGFMIYVPRNANLERAIEVVIRNEYENTLFPASGWIILDQDAQASVVVRQESAVYKKLNGISSLVLALDLRENSRLHFLETQQQAEGVRNFVNESSRLARGASLNQFVLDLGSSLNKRVLTVDLQGDGSQAFITGIYTPKADQVFVYDTHQNHNASHTNSDLLFSGALDQNAYSLWKGNVYVAKDTKGADGFQVNRNLLLDEAAHAESIPGLEIIADDVRCSHAVTLSSVDPEQMFFLESRGIGAREAEELIVGGFLEAASNRMDAVQLKDVIRELLN